MPATSLRYTPSTQAPLVPLSLVQPAVPESWARPNELRLTSVFAPTCRFTVNSAETAAGAGTLSPAAQHSTMSAAGTR